MQNHFAKTRKMLMLTAIAVPLLFFTAFVLCAAGRELWAFIPLVLGGALALCFPIKEIASPNHPKPARGPLLYLRAAAFALTTYWVLQIPEASDLLERLLGGALWDWKPLTAAGLWTLLSIHSGRQMASQLSDAMIFRYYEKPRQEIAQS